MDAEGIFSKETSEVQRAFLNYIYKIKQIDVGCDYGLFQEFDKAHCTIENIKIHLFYIPDSFLDLTFSEVINGFFYKDIDSDYLEMLYGKLLTKIVLE